MKPFRKIALSLAICFVLTQPIFSQKIWERDWRTWKIENTYKILNDSPWAKNCSRSNGRVPCRTFAASPLEDNNQTAETPPVIVRFYSSLKIRQALWRLNQLRDGYDKMDEKQKEKYDESGKDFLACGVCKKYYVITLFQSIVDESGRSIFREELKNEKPENLSEKIYLSNDKNEKRKLEQFSLPGQKPYMMTLYFSVLGDGQNALITEKTKKISLNFKTGLWQKGILERIEFDVSKMLINGKLDF